LKTILITGATSGIGEACANLFAENGYQLIITGRRKDKLEKLADNLSSQYNCPVLALNFDISDQAACENAISNLPPQFKKIDVLLNSKYFMVQCEMGS
jgi:NADP-dependent 3-hydroxy acid dehydrogenase YdfG